MTTSDKVELARTGFSAVKQCKCVGVVLQMKRVSVGGRLVPFFKCVCVYFVALGAGGAGEGGAPSPGAVAAKCAPVLCLLLAVLLPQSEPHKSVQIR